VERAKVDGKGRTGWPEGEIVLAPGGKRGNVYREVLIEHEKSVGELWIEKGETDSIHLRERSTTWGGLVISGEGSARGSSGNREERRSGAKSVSSGGGSDVIAGPRKGGGKRSWGKEAVILSGGRRKGKRQE